ncbi:sugar-binding protein [Streptomyces clavuligerus]|uniref:sugar-binding protein n=1 Tax=Streptomyces clavuligerus TaxID=1901 RepID=UPI001E4C244B|nr:sugar-binding protein [Streptomyces clavuligerus]
MPARPSDWSALGLGGDPVPGDTDALAKVADAMRELALSAGTVTNGLRELQNTAGDGQRFVGKTADSLREQVDEHLYRFVGRVEESFRMAENAVRAYSAAMATAQGEADQALSAAQGLSDDDPERQNLTQLAEDARSDLDAAASTLSDSLWAAGELMVQPVSDCDLFWEAFQWLTLIISVIAVFTGGILGILAWGMNAALLIKTVVDFSQGKATGLDLGLAFLGILFPSTKGINVGALLKGIGNSLRGGLGGLTGLGRNLWGQAGRFASITGLPRIVILPLLVGAKIAPALRIDLGAVLRGIGGGVRGGWTGLITAVTDDWARVTANATGSWGKVGAYTTVNLQRLGRFTLAALVPLNFAEMGALGIGGAARLAFAERVLGIPQPQLHRLLVNAGQFDALVRTSPSFTHTGSGSLVPSSFRPGGLLLPGGLGTVDLTGLSLARMPVLDLGSLGPGLARGGFSGITGLPPLHLPASLGAPPLPGGLGAITVPTGAPAGLLTPPTGAPGLLTPPPTGTPGLLTPPTGAPGLVAPPLPQGLTLSPGGLAVPAPGMSAGTIALHQADFAAGQVRLDSNLLVSGNTAVDLLRDARGPSQVGGTVQPGPALTGSPLPAVGSLGDGATLGRAAVGHAEALDDLTFPELRALAAGDVAVTSVRGDGITLRIGDAAPRTVDAQALASTAPVPRPAAVAQTPPMAAGSTPPLPGTVAGVQPPPAVVLAGAGDAAARSVPTPTPVNGAVQTLPAPSAVVSAPPSSAITGAVSAPSVPGAAARTAVPPPSAAIDGSLIRTVGDGTAGAPRLSAAPPPPVSSHDLALGLLRGDGPRTPGNPVGLSARETPVPGVSSRPALDGAGVAPGRTDTSALDLVARPGDRPGAPGSATGGAQPVPVTPEARISVPERVPDTASSGGRGTGRADPPGAGGGTGPGHVEPVRTAPETRPVPGPEQRPSVPETRVPDTRSPEIRAPEGRASVPDSAPDLPSPSALDKGKGRAVDVPEAVDEVVDGARGLPEGRISVPEQAPDLPSLSAVEKVKGPDAPSGSRWGGQAAALVMNQRIRAAHQVVIGDATGLRATERLNAWAAYERSLTELAKAEEQMDLVTPAPGTGASTGPTRAYRQSLESLLTARAEADRTFADLRALGIDPVATRQEIRTVTGRIWTERGGLLGGAREPRYQPGAPVGPGASRSTTGPGHPADDAMDTDESFSSSSSESGDIGGAHPWTPAGATGAPLFAMVNDAFQAVPGGGVGPFTASGYLTWVRESVDDSRPISYVVNTIVNYGELQDGLQGFLDSVTGGLDGFDGRVAVVIGVNGSRRELAEIGQAMQGALGGVSFPHPLALVATLVPSRATGFAYGTARNATLTSPVTVHLSRAMMDGGTHPYISIMDFDANPRIVPGGDHVFRHFEESLMPGDGLPPIRPLSMAGGYRTPDLTVPEAAGKLVKDTNDRLETAGLKDSKGDVPPSELNRLDQMIQYDMRFRDRMARMHPQAPYAPEPNFFVDAAATMLNTDGLEAVRFGDNAAEFQVLGERLNLLNAWELDRRLPIGSIAGVGGDRIPGLLRGADDLFVRPGGVAPRTVDVLRGLATAIRDGDPLLAGMDTVNLPRLLDTLADSLPGGPDALTPAEVLELRQGLWRLSEGYEARITLRRIDAANGVLPERGAAFHTDFQGAAVPTDVSRLFKGLWAGGRLPQAHFYLKQAMSRIFRRDESMDNDQDPREGLRWADYRDEWVVARPDPSGAGFGHTDPFRPVHHGPGDPASARTGTDLSAGLDPRLGTAANPVGMAVSARVGGAGSSLFAGVDPSVRRLLSHQIVLSVDTTCFLWNLRYLSHEHLARESLDRSPGSFFAALDNALPPVNGVDASTRMMNDLVRSLDPGQGSRAPRRAATELRHLQGRIDLMHAAGMTVDDFFLRLAYGRIHPPGQTLSGLRTAESPVTFGIGPGVLLLLGSYATALDRSIRVTATDGVTHEVRPDRGRGSQLPLEVTWNPHGEQPGWEVRLASADQGGGTEDGGPGRRGTGKRKDTGKQRETGKRRDTGKGKETEKRRDAGKGKDTGKGRDTGKRRDTGKARDMSDTGAGPSRPAVPSGEYDPVPLGVTALDRYYEACSELTSALAALGRLERPPVGGSSRASGSTESVLYQQALERARRATLAVEEAEDVLDDHDIDLPDEMSRLTLDPGAGGE